ncbi:hypothetical protein DERP_003153, partial [Dermatophagoides pteronyssinus]
MFPNQSSATTNFSISELSKMKKMRAHIYYRMLNFLVNLIIEEEKKIRCPIIFAKYQSIYLEFLFMFVRVEIGGGYRILATVCCRVNRAKETICYNGVVLMMMM